VTYSSVTLNVGGSSGFGSNTCSDTFCLDTYSTYSAILIQYILDSNSLEQAFAMAYSTDSVRRNRQRTVQCHPVFIVSEIYIVVGICQNVGVTKYQSWVRLTVLWPLL